MPKNKPNWIVSTKISCQIRPNYATRLKGGSGSNMWLISKNILSVCTYLGIHIVLTYSWFTKFTKPLV